jgi:hypothetical protein
VKHEPKNAFDVATKVRLPRNFPKAIRAAFEKAIEAHIAAAEALTAAEHLNAVEALTAALDEADGDPEAEASLGSFDTLGNYSQELWAQDSAAGDEREKDAGDEGEAGQDEDPELGWTERVNQASPHFHGTAWGGFDGGEPSLGSLDREMNQAKWSRGNRSDLEEQCEDEGYDSDREMECEDEGAEHDGTEPPCSAFELAQDGAQ